MLTLKSNITIGDYTYNGVVEFNAQSTWETLTDTASITFPRKVEWQGKELATGDSPLIRRGDPVLVELGYDQGSDVIYRAIVFRGFVTSIHATIPIVVDCEDAAWLLKQQTLKKSYKDAQLSDLLKDLLPSTVPSEGPQVRLGPFRISNATPAMVFEKIREKYFLKSWFRAGKMYCGFAYLPALQSRHTIRFDQHVVENDLKYVNEEDVKISLKIISVSPDNKKTEYQFGDPDGEVRTVYYYDKNASDVNHMGSQEIERLRYTGYRGSLTIFGDPFVQHGDVLDIHDPFYPERDGSYLVKSVEISFGSGGFRQLLTLDIKV